MSEKKAKEARKAQQPNWIIKAHIYKNPDGLRALVAGIPDNFNDAMTCCAVIMKTIAGYFVESAKKAIIPKAEDKP